MGTVVNFCIYCTYNFCICLHTIAPSQHHSFAQDKCASCLALCVPAIISTNTTLQFWHYTMVSALHYRNSKWPLALPQSLLKLCTPASRPCSFIACCPFSVNFTMS